MYEIEGPVRVRGRSPCQALARRRTASADFAPADAVGCHPRLPACGPRLLCLRFAIRPVSRWTAAAAAASGPVEVSLSRHPPYVPAQDQF